MINGSSLRAESSGNVTFHYFKERVIGAAVITTEDYAMKCIKLAQFSRYELISDIDFAVAAPKAFMLCLRRSEAQTFGMDFDNCTQCGLMNLLNKRAQFNGYYIYEKLWTWFVAITESYDNNSVRFWTDARLNNITGYTIENEAPNGTTTTYSARFVILESHGNRYARVADERPYYIAEYSAEPVPLTIRKDALVQKRTNTVTLLTGQEIAPYEKRINILCRW